LWDLAQLIVGLLIKTKYQILLLRMGYLGVQDCCIVGILEQGCLRDEADIPDGLKGAFDLGL